MGINWKRFLETPSKVWSHWERFWILKNPVKLINFQVKSTWSTWTSLTTWSTNFSRITSTVWPNFYGSIFRTTRWSRCRVEPSVGIQFLGENMKRFKAFSRNSVLKWKNMERFSCLVAFVGMDIYLWMQRRDSVIRLEHPFGCVYGCYLPQQGSPFEQQHDQISGREFVPRNEIHAAALFLGQSHQ